MNKFENIACFLDETLIQAYNLLQGIYDEEKKHCYDSLDTLSKQIHQIAVTTALYEKELTSHQKTLILNCRHSLFMIWLNASIIARRTFYKQIDKSLTHAST